MGKKDDDGWKNLNDPARKQDPYVTGSSGEGNDSGCSDKAAAMVIATVAIGYTIRAMLRGRS